MSSDNSGHESYEQGKRDVFTSNPNPNPPQTSYERARYDEGRREAEYHQSQQPK